MRHLTLGDLVFALTPGLCVLFWSAVAMVVVAKAFHVFYSPTFPPLANNETGVVCLCYMVQKGAWRDCGGFEKGRVFFILILR